MSRYAWLTDNALLQVISLVEASVSLAMPGEAASFSPDNYCRRPLQLTSLWKLTSRWRVDAS